MKKSLNDILKSNGEIPSKASLKAYLKEELSNKDAHLFEKKSLENEFGSEAMEGLEELDDLSLLDEVDQLIDQKTKEKSNPNFFWIGIAASILLLFGLSWFFISDDLSGDTHLKLAETDKKEEQLPLPEQETEISVVKRDVQLNKTTSAITEKEPFESDEIPQIETSNEDALMEMDEASELDAKEASAPIQSGNFVSGAAFEDRSLPKEEAQHATKNSVKELKQNSAKHKSATAEKHVYAAPIVVETEMKKADGITEVSFLFKQAKQNFEQKQFETALSEFNQVLLFGKTAYQKEAEWLKANCLVELDRPKKALLILDKIISEGGAFANEAEKLKKRLE